MARIRVQERGRGGKKNVMIYIYSVGYASLPTICGFTFHFHL